MAVFSGKDGKLEFENVGITRVSNWSLNATVDTLETTNLGEAARTYTSGLKGASGSATLYYHDDNKSVRTFLNNCITIDAQAEGGMELIWADKTIRFKAWIN